MTFWPKTLFALVFPVGLSVTIVPKPDGSPRFCIDYRKLNNVTTPDQYTLPNIAEIVDLIGQAKVFSTLDLKRGYWQIAIEDASIPKTAFRCHRGLFEFREMLRPLFNVSWILF